LCKSDREISIKPEPLLSSMQVSEHPTTGSAMSKFLQAGSYYSPTPYYTATSNYAPVNYYSGGSNYYFSGGKIHSFIVSVISGLAL
jgi:hypothetical protein